MNKVAAVVVTYNRVTLLKQCISALFQQTVDCDVLLVDNASTDGTAEWVKENEMPRLHYRSTGANIGGAGGFNFGMRWAVEAGYEYVWIMDDDCLPNPDALQKLLEADGVLGGPENYGFLSSAVLWTDGTGCRMNRQKMDRRCRESEGLRQQGIVRVVQATFVSLLFPAKVIRRVGLPIKDFFIWGDDVEYTRRLSLRAKIPCYMVRGSRVIHAMKENNGSNLATDVPERIGRYRYAFRNEAYLYRKEGIRGVFYYLAKCGWNVVKIFLFAKSHRAERFSVMFSAIMEGMRFRPREEYIGAEEMGDAEKV